MISFWAATAASYTPRSPDAKSSRGNTFAVANTTKIERLRTQRSMFRRATFDLGEIFVSAASSSTLGKKRTQNAVLHRFNDGQVYFLRLSRSNKLRRRLGAPLRLANIFRKGTSFKRNVILGVFVYDRQQDQNHTCGSSSEYSVSKYAYRLASSAVAQMNSIAPALEFL